MLTPISCSGASPTKSASGRLTRRMFCALVVDDDVIADRVKDFDPVPVGLLHAGKETGIFKGNGGMAGDRAQELNCLLARLGADPRSARQRIPIMSPEAPASRTSVQSVQPRVATRERGRASSPAGGKHDVGIVLGEHRMQLRVETPQQRLVVDFGGTAQQHGFRVQLFGKRLSATARASQNVGGAASKIPGELAAGAGPCSVPGRARPGLRHDGGAARTRADFGVSSRAIAAWAARALGAAHVFVGNVSGLALIEHAEHSQHARHWNRAEGQPAVA